MHSRLLAMALGSILAACWGGAARAQETDPVEMTEATRQAVARALAYLKRHQQPNGAWRGDIGFKLNYGYEVIEGGQDQDHVGVTSLACMAFLAAGNVPGRGQYGEVVQRGLRFVLDCVDTDKGGYITQNGSRMYSHAFATLFLAEILGMHPDREVLEKLRLAVKFIVDNQNEAGGWRYAPLAADSDMSIVVCQVQALRAARNVGIAVPIHTIRKAQKYVQNSAQGNGRFLYQNNQPSRDSFAMAAAGVTALQGMATYDDVMVERGLEAIEAMRAEEVYGSYFYFYGHYYAVQAMYIGGLKWPDKWRRWYPTIRDDLLAHQERSDTVNDGCWRNVSRGRQVGPGDNFGTAMGALILQIPYRYLPIFQR